MMISGDVNEKEGKTMIEIEIYWDDLKKDIQDEFIEKGIYDENWDIFPVFTYITYVDEEEE